MFPASTSSTLRRRVLASQLRALDATRRLGSHLRTERGAVLGEYGLMIALVAVTLIALLIALSDDITSVFTDTNEGLDQHSS